MIGVPHIVVIMPALNEAGSIGAVIDDCFTHGARTVIVGDNGSTDQTVRIARDRGAVVTHQPQRGYGSACLAALAKVPSGADVIVFCDADGADDLSRLRALTTPILRGQADMVLGSRHLGNAAKGALTLPQRAGNLMSALLMRLLYRQRVTDLGPFRAISPQALERLHMQDPAYGWTAEMQVKAYRLGMRVLEIPVDARLRTAGESKVSGRLVPVFKAGWFIISTILSYHRRPIVATKPVKKPIQSPQQLQTAA